MRPAVCALLAWGVACGRSDNPRSGNSTVGTTTGASAGALNTSGWNPQLGVALLVPSDSDSTGILLYPADVADLRRDGVTLVTPAGDSSHATLDTASSDQACGDAAILRIAGARPAWSAGFVGLSARPVRMDSIEAMSPRDSARLAAEIARLASGLASGAAADFRGLPFVVVAAHSLRWTGRDVLVAHLVRRLNQEASPREDRTLLIAERVDSTPFSVVLSDRSEGTEETAEHFDALAALQAGSDLLLLIARDQDARTRYDLLDRSPDGVWQMRWTRTVGC